MERQYEDDDAFNSTAEAVQLEAYYPEIARLWNLTMMFTTADQGVPSNNTTVAETPFMSSCDYC